MIDPSGESDLGWVEWVIGWELDVEEEDTPRVW